MAGWLNEWVDGKGKKIGREGEGREQRRKEGRREGSPCTKPDLIQL